MKANHVNPEEALQVALDLGSKKNYAMHWGTFQLTDEETLEPPALLEEALTKNEHYVGSAFDAMFLVYRADPWTLLLGTYRRGMVPRTFVKMCGALACPSAATC